MPRKTCETRSDAHRGRKMGCTGQRTAKSIGILIAKNHITNKVGSFPAFFCPICDIRGIEVKYGILFTAILFNWQIPPA